MHKTLRMTPAMPDRPALVPAKAGTQGKRTSLALDSRFRGNDGWGASIQTDQTLEHYPTVAGEGGLSPLQNTVTMTDGTPSSEQ